jgi:hypothetical protein
VSPYVGLFGTVWGIMHAFVGLSNLTQVTLATVAPGIAEALVATAIGLFAAIPAVIAYNRFARQIDRIAITLETFIEEFSNILQRNAHGPGCRPPAAELNKEHCHAGSPFARPAPPHHQRDQHGALHRRDAGAADHLHGQRAADHHRPGRPAERRQEPPAARACDPVVVGVDEKLKIKVDKLEPSRFDGAARPRVKQAQGDSSNSAGGDLGRQATSSTRPSSR